METRALLDINASPYLEFNFNEQMKRMLWFKFTTHSVLLVSIVELYQRKDFFFLFLINNKLFKENIGKI